MRPLYQLAAMNPSSIEVLNSALERRRFRAVIFDFDGTLSLFREGWSRIMISMMVEMLRDQKLVREADDVLWSHIDAFVMELNGKPSIYQMERFAEEVHLRGGTARESTYYLQEFLTRLMSVVEGRWAEITTGKATTAQWVVPGAHGILTQLRERGLPLYIASGTDIVHVRHEANLLEVAPFFGPHIYAPAENTREFSKRGVIERILSEQGIDGSELLGFGDGVTETMEVKRVGGVAVAVASAEKGESGVNSWKRDSLTAAGADVVIPDYKSHEELMARILVEG
jgi:phosphoglycolate phosphatase